MSRKGCAWPAGLAVVVCVAVVVAVVVVIRRDDEPALPSASSTSNARPVTHREPTSWDAISAQQDDSGRLTLDGALQAFGYLFEPLPGAPAPPPATPEPGMHSRSAAMLAVISHWDELTADQRTVVLRYVADPETPPPSTGVTPPRPRRVDPAPSDPPTDTNDVNATPGTTPSQAAPSTTSTPGSDVPASSRPTGTGVRSTTGARPATPAVAMAPPTTAPSPPTTAPQAPAAVAHRLLVELRSIAQDEAAKLGWQFADASYINLHLTGTEPPSDPNINGTVGGWTVPYTAGATIGPEDADFSLGDPLQSCEVYLPPSSWQLAPNDGTGGVPWELLMMLAHEAFHCMQAFGMGTTQTATFMHQPDWVIEGSAEWAGYRELNIAPDPWWDTYLTTPELSLTKRNYDGLGVFYLTEQLGRPLWPEWVGIWSGISGANVGTDEWLRTITGPVDQTFGETWGSSYYRETAWSTSWDYTSPTITNTYESIDQISSNATVGVEPFATLQRDVEEGSGQVVVGHTDLPMRWRDHDGKEKVASSFAFCTDKTNHCRCPDDGPRGGDEADTATFPLHVGLADRTGTGGTLTVAYKTLEEHCKQDNRDGSPGGGGGGASGGGSGDDTENAGAGCTTGCGKDTGDPHLTTIDGYHYDFMAAGEFTALSAGDGFELQTRQEMMARSSGMSVNTAVALSVMGDRVGLYARDGGVELRVDGDLTSLDEVVELPGGGRILRDSGGADITWPDGSEVWVLPLQSATQGLHVLVRVADDRASSATGLLGPAPEYRLAARDGTTIDLRTPVAGSAAYDDLYRTFGDSWRISADTSLFDYSADTSTETYDQRQYPDNARSIDQLSPDDRRRGEEACAGVRDAQLRDDCILDVAISGEAEMADGYDVVQATIQPAGTLRPGSVVTDRRIEAETADRFRIVVDEPGAIYLRHGDEDVQGTVTWTLTDASGVPGSTTIIGEDLGRSPATAPGVYTLTITADKDSSATYGFSVIDATPDQRFDIAIGDQVGPDSPAAGAGNIEAWGAHDVYTFTGRAGDQIQVHGRDCSDVSRIVFWELHADEVEGDQVAGRGFECTDDETVELPTDGTYQLVFSTAVTGVTFYLYDLAPDERYDGRYAFELRRA